MLRWIFNFKGQSVERQEDCEQTGKDMEGCGHRLLQDTNPAFIWREQDHKTSGQPQYEPGTSGTLSRGAKHPYSAFGRTKWNQTFGEGKP